MTIPQGQCTNGRPTVVNLVKNVHEQLQPKSPYLLAQKNQQKIQAEQTHNLSQSGTSQKKGSIKKTRKKVRVRKKKLTKRTIQQKRPRLQKRRTLGRQRRIKPVQRTRIPLHSRLISKRPLKNITISVKTIRPAKAHVLWKKLQREPLFAWPLQSDHFWVSSLFGPRKLGGRHGFHAGVDLAAPRGTPVYAAAGGVIDEACYSAGYGNYILIAHNRKFKTRYAHLDKIHVRSGQVVNSGDCIGRVGATGFVRKSRRGGSASHLHFEVYMKGKPVNPFFFLA